MTAVRRCNLGDRVLVIQSDLPGTVGLQTRIVEDLRGKLTVARFDKRNLAPGIFDWAIDITEIPGLLNKAACMDWQLLPLRGDPDSATDTEAKSKGKEKTKCPS